MITTPDYLDMADNILCKNDIGCAFRGKKSIYFYLGPKYYEVTKNIPSLKGSYKKMKYFGDTIQRGHLLIMKRKKDSLESFQDMSIYIFSLTLLGYLNGFYTK